MPQYIDKSAVVEEIERLLSIYNDDENIHHIAKYNILVDLLSFLDTLEVKEVDEEYNGKAMLHVLEKGVKQGKRELIDKACEWLINNVGHYSTNTLGAEYMCEDFRKAMEK